MKVEGVPANAGLISYLSGRARQYNYTDLTEVHGTHPDLVSRLWDELGKLLPEDCHTVVYGTPVLLRPSTGIIFAFAGGTHTYAFRLPPDSREPAIASGATRVYHYRSHQLQVEVEAFDLAIVGDEWVFGGWLKGEDDWIKAAYEFATIL